MNKSNNFKHLEQAMINTLKIKNFDEEMLKNVLVKLQQINAKLYFYDSLTAVPSVKPEPIYDSYNDSGRNLIGSGNPIFLNQEVLKYISASSIRLSQINTRGLFISSCFSNNEEYFISDDEGFWGDSAFIQLSSLMLDQKTAYELKAQWLGAGRNNKIKDRISIAEHFFNNQRTKMKLDKNASNQDIYDALCSPTKAELWNMLSDFSNTKLYKKLGKLQEAPSAIDKIRDALDIEFKLGTDKGRKNISK